MWRMRRNEYKKRKCCRDCLLWIVCLAATENISDGNVEDKRRVDNGAHEKYKEAHPVNVEKYEKVTYAIRVVR